MLFGCGCGLMWSRKASRGPILEDNVDAPHILIETLEEHSPILGKANVVRFCKPNRIDIERSRALSPESIRK